MKIRRYLDKDTRSAMGRVRQDLGPDAVIVSNRNIGGQIELVAAVDLDEAQLAAAASAPAERPIASVTPLPQAFDTPLKPVPGGAQEASTLFALQREMESLRSMIEGRLSNTSWQDAASAAPANSALLARLGRLGLSRSLSGLIADAMPEGGDIESNWTRALGLLAQRIPVAEPDALLSQGGIVCLVGATGVGKTTTLAKLAARYVKRFGRDKLAILTTDCYRIGAQEQLQTLATHLQVPALATTDARSLKRALSRLGDKRLVLIDTAGLSQQDPLLQKQFKMINSVGYTVRSHVVLPASAQLQVLQQTVDAFGADSLAGAILTKLDETTAMGSVLDVVAERGLPVQYACNGQKVPRDLKPASGADLISLAVKSMDKGDDPTAQQAGGSSAGQQVAV